MYINQDLLNEVTIVEPLTRLKKITKNALINMENSSVIKLHIALDTLEYIGKYASDLGIKNNFIDDNYILTGEDAKDILENFYSKCFKNAVSA